MPGSDNSALNKPYIDLCNHFTNVHFILAIWLVITIVSITSGAEQAKNHCWIQSVMMCFMDKHMGIRSLGDESVMENDVN